ncbi:MAG TPA: NAD(P)-binding domain-containing protein [Gaiellaceae bacterium]|nr:NAD(P)-binding domain-containing protein [Gaiellaceae bacterium]
MEVARARHVRRPLDGDGPRPERVETVIVGGGQAGLAMGYHLAQRGRPFVILDAGARIGDTWRKRWTSLRVFTPARYSGLPGWPFPAPAWSYPGKDEVADYLEAYATRFDLPVRLGSEVERLSRQGDRYLLTVGERRLEAGHVVIATGQFPRPNVPAFASELDPGIVQLHSSEYRDPSELQEGPVLVVGAGNSGAEIAFELSRSATTLLSGSHPGSEPMSAGSRVDRLLTPPYWFFLSRVMTVRTPIGRKLRPKLLDMTAPLARVKPRDLAAAGVERVPRTVGVQDGRPLLDDGRVVDVANVIWCTGYEADWGWVDLPVFGDDGRPVHDRGIVPGEPGLYFLGLFFLSAITSFLIGGVGKDAEHLARHIAARTGSRGRAGDAPVARRGR